MKAYEYSMALAILLLVKTSLARPEQTTAEISTPKIPEIVATKINDSDVQNDSKVSYNFHASQQIFYMNGPLHGKSSCDDVSKIEFTAKDCCVNITRVHAEGHELTKLTIPLVKLGEKRYYFGIFFKTNWYKASQYCRYHGMHLVSIASQQENDMLETHIKDLGLGDAAFWTSGTDQADEGSFFWMGNGRPFMFKNWLPGEPNDVRDKKDNGENCVELWDREGKGFKWNDRPCMGWEVYFICEEQ